MRLSFPASDRLPARSEAAMSLSYSDLARLVADLTQADRVLHAWVCLDPAPRSAAHGPLTGLVFGVKDVIDVAGLATRCGSPVTDDRPAAVDADCVAALRAAAALPLGKTVTAEFAHVSPGPTRNPRQLSHTPGGSSSGSAAAVAAGMVDFALSTQTGGSIIRPAAFCGVVGFKPSYGAVSRAGMQVMCPSLDTIGWHARDVDMAARVAGVLLPPQPCESPRRPRVRVLPAQPGYHLEPAALEAVRHAGRTLGDAGYAVAQTEAMPQSQDLLRTHGTVVHYELTRALTALSADADPARDERLSPRLRADLRQGQALAHADYEAALARLHAARRRDWEADFGDSDLVLTSSALGPAPHGLSHTGESGFNKAWSVLGWPCLHLPTTQDDRGLPLGVMLVARPGMDPALLRWAGEIHSLIDRRDTASLPSLNRSLP